MPPLLLLLDLRLLENHVLARNGVVLAEADLVGGRPRVLLRHVEEAGAGAAEQLDLLRIGFCHDARAPMLSRMVEWARTLSPRPHESRCVSGPMRSRWKLPLRR